MNDPLEWYYDIPIVSRLYLTSSFLTTTACALDLVSPFSLYFNFNLIFFKGQVRHDNHSLSLLAAILTIIIIENCSLVCIYDWVLMWYQVWRLVTNFLFFGLFSLDFLFHMYFV